jgi:hypothetical protein
MAVEGLKPEHGGCRPQRHNLEHFVLPGGHGHVDDGGAKVIFEQNHAGERDLTEGLILGSIGTNCAEDCVNTAPRACAAREELRLEVAAQAVARNCRGVPRRRERGQCAALPQVGRVFIVDEAEQVTRAFAERFGVEVGRVIDFMNDVVANEFVGGMQQFFGAARLATGVKRKAQSHAR